jgi:hypothetical protein
LPLELHSLAYVDSLTLTAALDGQTVFGPKTAGVDFGGITAETKVYAFGAAK